MTDYLWGYDPEDQTFTKMERDAVIEFFGCDPEEVMRERDGAHAVIHEAARDVLGALASDEDIEAIIDGWCERAATRIPRRPSPAPNPLNRLSLGQSTPYNQALCGYAAGG